MSQRKRDKLGKLPPFVAMPWEILNSPAFISLRHYSRAALPYFFGKVKLVYHHPDRFNMPFAFSYNEGKRYGFPTATFSKAIAELVEKGFIDPVQKGGCYGDLKASNQFSLSQRWENYGKPQFKDLNWHGFIQKPRKAA